MKKIFILIFGALFFLVGGCHSNKSLSSVVTKSYELQPFKAIILSGGGSVEIVNGSHFATITGIEKQVLNCKFRVKNNILYINIPEFINLIKISVPKSKLKNITVADNVVIKAKNFKSDNLIINAKGNGSVKLDGQYAISKIYQRGNGRIDIKWINSDNLLVDSNSNGPLDLAGVVKYMVVKLSNKAKLDARYLRAKRADVFTADKAQADVSVLNDLNAFAVDFSNIFYYKRPKNMNVVTKDHGNVLHPDWLS